MSLSIRSSSTVSRSLFRQAKSLPPASYVDRLYYELFQEFSLFLKQEHLIIVDKLFHLIEYDYGNKNLIGRGYHCLEHSLEVATLLLETCRFTNGLSNQPYWPDWVPELYPDEQLELAIAAILHDYDPHSSGGTPVVARTIHVLKTDEYLHDLLERLHQKISRLVLLIERTDYPFPLEKETAWEGELLLHFRNEIERNRFRGKAERLALCDKGSTYFCLTPEQAHRRVEALADEIKVPKDVVLAQTSDFLEREKVAALERWVPHHFRERWFLVERHFHLFKQRAPEIEKNPYLDRINK